MTLRSGKQIIPADFPELKRLVWNGDPSRPVEADEVFALYERNWRFVDKHHLTDHESMLIDGLGRLHGKGFGLR